MTSDKNDVSRPGALLTSAAILAAFSLLAVCRAPALPFWYLAIVVTEWGYGVACLLALIMFFVPWRAARGRWAGALLIASIALCLSPLWRAHAIAKILPGDLQLAFGSAPPRQRANAPARRVPMNGLDLWAGIASPPVQKTTHVYGVADGQTLALNLFRPLQIDHLLPGILVIHGGSWRTGDKEGFDAFNRYFAARGYAVAPVDYRLAPRSTFPAPRQDVGMALDWLRHNAATYHLDANRWVILGRSAGGEIALSAAYTRKQPFIKGVVVFYAPNDLMFAYSRPDNPLIMNSRKVIATYMGGTPEQKPQLYSASSALAAIDAQTPPTLMIHGLRDELVWAVHADRLSACLAMAHRPYYFLKLPWATHACDIHFNGPSGQLSLYATEYFLAAVMPAKTDVAIGSDKINSL